MLRVNSSLTISNIPEEVHQYRLGSRSALDWFVERFRLKDDKASGLRNDPNDWGIELGEENYILDLAPRIVTLSVKSAEIIRKLPPLRPIMPK